MQSVGLPAVLYSGFILGLGNNYPLEPIHYATNGAKQDPPMITLYGEQSNEYLASERGGHCSEWPGRQAGSPSFLPLPSFIPSFLPLLMPEHEHRHLARHCVRPSARLTVRPRPRTKSMQIAVMSTRTAPLSVVRRTSKWGAQETKKEVLIRTEGREGATEGLLLRPWSIMRWAHGLGLRFQTRLDLIMAPRVRDSYKYRV